MKINALWESSVNSMFWKPSNFGTVYMSLLILAHACHSWRDRDTAVNIDVVRHNMLLLLHIIARSKSWFRINTFSGSTRLLWIQVSLQIAVLCKHECHFVSGISQSNFCIFHKTTESLIIYTVYNHTWGVCSVQHGVSAKVAKRRQNCGLIFDFCSK